jgi:hypothetical protein
MTNKQLMAWLMILAVVFFFGGWRVLEYARFEAAHGRAKRGRLAVGLAVVISVYFLIVLWLLYY